MTQQFNPSRRLLACAALAACAMPLVACSDESPRAASAAPNGPPLTKESLSPRTLAANTTGFSVGPADAARTVYVFFDMQCPHCGDLWLAALPLQASARFVWMPVSVMGPASLPQGATVLAAADPGAAMTEHKTSMSAGGRGITADRNAVEKFGAAVKANTDALRAIGGQSIPYLVSAMPDGSLLQQPGAMSTVQLRELLKL